LAWCRGNRSNKRIQIFTADGEFLGQWTGMGGPNDITRATDGNFHIAEQEDEGEPASALDVGQRRITPGFRRGHPPYGASTALVPRKHIGGAGKGAAGGAERSADNRSDRAAGCSPPLGPCRLAGNRTGYRVRIPR